MTTPTHYYQTRFTHDPNRKRVWQEVVRYISRDIVDHTSILDLGCGYGDFINTVRADRKVAVDLHDGLRGYLAQDVNFVCGDCANLAFLENESMGTVFASNLLEHLQRDRILTLLAEIRRVLRLGGRLILIQPNFRLCSKNYFDDYTHVTVFSDISLCNLLQAEGFDICRCTPGLLPFSMKSYLPKHPLMVRLFLNSPVRPLARQMYVVAENLRKG
jgi:SAM-dependent methyltransferase